jgi:hypothetical protein
MCANKTVFVAATLLLAFGALAPLAAEAQTRTASVSTAAVAPRGLTQQQIQGAVVPYRREVRECVFQDEAALPPNVMLVAELHIGANGVVQRASMHESNSGLPAVDSCVIEVLRGVTFPATADGESMAVRYPFIFVTGN